MAAGFQSYCQAVGYDQFGISALSFQTNENAICLLPSSLFFFVWSGCNQQNNQKRYTTTFICVCL
jgi:hypothetical protein